MVPTDLDIGFQGLNLQPYIWLSAWGLDKPQKQDDPQRQQYAKSHKITPMTLLRESAKLLS